MVHWRNILLLTTLVWIALLFARVLTYKLTGAQCPGNPGIGTKFALEGLLLSPAVVWGCRRVLGAWENAARLRATGALIVSTATVSLLAAALAGGLSALRTSDTSSIPNTPALDALELGLLYACCLVVVGGIRTARDYRAERLLRSHHERMAEQERLKALRSQLNPHFLFNSLGSIADLVETDPLLAQQLVTGLGTLLHGTIQASEHETHELSQELAYVESYLKIQEIRRASSISWQVRAERACLASQVPTLILLPLIENAVTHGAPLGNGLPIQVTIEARAQHKELVLRVTNSCAARGPKGGSACAGIGLRNTRERLRLLFGEAAAFAENCNTPGRFEAEIRLPAADCTRGEKDASSDSR